MRKELIMASCTVRLSLELDLGRGIYLSTVQRHLRSWGMFVY